MRSNERGWLRWLSAGLLLGGAGCSDPSGNGSGKGGDRPASDAQLHGAKTALLRADSCDDLLTKIQNDAIAKLDLTLARTKDNYENQAKSGGDLPVGIATVGGGNAGSDPIFAPVPGPGASAPPAATSPVTSGSGGAVAGTIGGLGGAVGGVAGGGGTGGGLSAGTPTTDRPSDNGDSVALDAPEQQGAGASDGKGEPTGASDTNTQVEGVDEADFIKLVDGGKGMFLLHNNTLLKLKTYPAEQLSLEPAQLKIEGAPSELFVTDAGHAVIFSSVYGYGFGGGIGDQIYADPGFCGPGFCSGGKGGYYGGNATKITIADVSGGTLKTLREIYYEGGYVSSRRYGDVVRVILQSASSYSGLYQPEVDTSDPWGRPYPKEEVFDQLDQWRDRVASSIRNTLLNDWVPQSKEAKDGKLVDIAPDCDSYFVPQPGLSDSGLTHVLSLDASKPDAAVGGVTVMGQANTVYSNAERLVLAQPDYRWLSDNGVGDLGFIPEQRTSLHMFGLAGDKTEYLASGWVRGLLPANNTQFGLDVSEDHTLRLATTGEVRLNPNAASNDVNFWQTDTDNRVSTLRQKGDELELVGTSDKLGHTRETVRSARFVGDRAYVVTAVQTDPLIVLDVSAAEKPTVLGEIQIPGFSSYVHPLDDDHLVTFGDSGSRGSQLQLFDVSDPKHIPQPKVLDFGSGSSSEVANDHKAFTFYAPENLIALPVSGSRVSNGLYSYMAALRVIRVNVDTGFELLGSIDHSGFYASESGCFSCGSWGCNALCYDGGSAQVRRGQFVENKDTTYVYAIGSAGVSVSDLTDVSKPIVEVKLPQTQYDTNPWYSASGAPLVPGTAVSGGSFTGGIGGTFGGGFAGTNAGTVAVPPTAWPLPDGGITFASDAGAPVPVQDAGAIIVVPSADAGVAVAPDAG